MTIAKHIIIGFLVIFFSFSLTKNLFEYRRNLEFYESYKEEYKKVKEQNNKLQAKLVKMNDFYEMEKKIRNNLNLLKWSETAVIIPKPSPTPTVITPTPQPNYEQWVDTFLEN